MSISFSLNSVWHFHTFFLVLYNMLFRYCWISVELDILQNLPLKDHIVKGGIVADFYSSHQEDFTEINVIYGFLLLYSTLLSLSYLARENIFKWIQMQILILFYSFCHSFLFLFLYKITFPM